MKTYDEVFRNVMEATNAHRRKVKRIQSTISASVICVVCIIGASMYVRLKKPESVPPGQETTTDCRNMQMIQETDHITPIKNTETGTESKEIPGETQENFQEASQESTEETQSLNSQESDMTTEIAESGTHQTTQVHQTEIKTEIRIEMIEIIEIIEIIETLASGTEPAVIPVQPEESESYPENTGILVSTETLEILETPEILETSEILETLETLPAGMSSRETSAALETTAFETTTTTTTTTTTVPEMPEEFEIFSDFPTDQTRTETIVS
ncbi:MAG: hypothetical protein K2J71_07035 [Oscillospiraceae bacterium]|nr:hypothetical protein [Oscillospiraceae bacterium]